MKDLARALARSGLKPPSKRGKGTSTRTRERNPNDPRFVSDSWDPTHHPEPETAPTVVETPREAKPVRAGGVVDKGPELEPQGPEMKQSASTRRRRKRRHYTLTFSASEEEADLLKAHAAKLDMTFSAWARKTLFRAMGRKIPARPNRD
jgi:hypothetical protein